MEVACSVQSLRSVRNIHRISVWNAAQLALLSFREQEDMRNIIDGMGRLSAQAQHLRTPITDYGRLKAGSHTLYLCTTGVQGKPELVLAKGMLKVGRKNLFIRKDNGQLVEMSPLCVLDFYVHESCQRMGLGHELFETMLSKEKASARELGYDRPSSKFHSFLEKYYHLTEFLPQANQYVVFKDYFNVDQTNSNGACALDERGRSPGTGFLESSGKKDKVLHGRRATVSESSNSDAEFCPARKSERDVKGSHDVGVADPCTVQQQPPSGRRQSRHHMANLPVVNKVPCHSNSVDTQRHVPSLSSSTAANDRDSSGVRKHAAAAGEYKPSIHGRRSTLSGPSKSTDARKASEKAYARYPSPPCLPKPLENEPKDDSCCNPYKFPRTESTRSRIFHEDCFVQIARPAAPPLKCPFWTEDAPAFRTKNSDTIDKINLLASAPVSFENTRSCYHAGMKGYGAAEAMGWSSSLIK